MADRIELALAALTSITANVHRDQKERPEPFKVDDFMVRRRLPESAEGEDTGDDESEDGLEPEQVTLVMDRFVRRQEQRDKALRGRSAP